MLKVSKTFIEKMKTYGKQINILVEFGGTILNRDNVVSLEQNINGELFTSIMRLITLEVEKYSEVDFDTLLTVNDVHTRTVEELDNKRVKYLTSEEKQENITSASEVNIKLGVKYEDDEEYEYIDFGTFEVYDIEDCVDTQSYKLTLYDYLVETHVKYDDDPLNLNFASGDITVGILLKAICDKFGFNLITPTFVNSNNVISEDKYLGLNYTYRDILDEISAVAGGFIKIFNKDLSVDYPKETGEVIDEDDLETLDLKSVVGPFNTVVLGRSPQEDNIYYPTGISEDDRVAIRIDNNQIMDRNREDYIVNLYNKLNGLYYYAFEYQSFGFGYFEFGDIVTLRDLNGNQCKTILLNLIQTVNQGIKEKAYSEKTEFAEKTDYDCATSIEKRVTNTEILTNKQQNQIKLIIEQRLSDTIKINSIEMDLNSTKSEIANYEEENDIKINTLIQTATTLTGEINNIKTDIENNIYTKTETSALISSSIEDATAEIKLELSQTFLKQSDLDNYSTTTEVNNIINQKISESENTILSQVSNTYITQNTLNEYSTTTQMNNAISQSITNAENSILLSVSNTYVSQNAMGDYTKNSEIVSKLNLGIENGQGVIKFKTNSIIIDADNCKLTANGVITLNAGTIAGLTMSRNSNQNSFLSKNYSNSSGVQFQSGLYIPNQTDGSSVFLYAGCPLSGYLSDANLYIRHDGLIKAKWLQINGQSGYFNIYYDNGRTAMNLSSSGLTFYLNDNNNNLFSSYVYGSAGTFIHLNSSPLWAISDSLHDLGMFYFYRYEPNSTSAQIQRGHVAQFFADVDVWGNRQDGVNYTMHIKGYEVATNASDKRLKDNIKDSNTNALKTINKIKIRQFDWKTDKGLRDGGKHINCGFIAQEVQKVDETLVHYDIDYDTYQMENLNLIGLSYKSTKEIIEILKLIAKEIGSEKIIKILEEI